MGSMDGEQLLGPHPLGEEIELGPQVIETTCRRCGARLQAYADEKKPICQHHFILSDLGLLPWLAIGCLLAVLVVAVLSRVLGG